MDGFCVKSKERIAVLMLVFILGMYKRYLVVHVLSEYRVGLVKHFLQETYQSWTAVIYNVDGQKPK